MSDSASKDLMTVVENVYHTSMDGGSNRISSSFERRLESKEQMYQRTNATAKASWQRIEYGWLEDNIGMVVIVNKEGRNLQMILSPEETEVLNKKTLDLLFVNPNAAQEPMPDIKPHIRIRPGESARFCPSQALYARSLNGDVKYSVSVVPS